MHWTPFCRGKLLCHISVFSPQTMPVSLQNVKTHVPRFFSTKWETCKINIMCILECWHTPKPLQNQEPTVSANYKMFPLQNQEPAFAYPCRHLGCPKKWFWRTPAGPDNGMDFFGVYSLIHQTLCRNGSTSSAGGNILDHFDALLVPFAPKDVFNPLPQWHTTNPRTGAIRRPTRCVTSLTFPWWSWPWQRTEIMFQFSMPCANLCAWTHLPRKIHHTCSEIKPQGCRDVK